MIDKAFEHQWNGWSITTAEITYRLPDHHHILQTYLWQDYDIAPKFPRLIKFLDFWSGNLDGPVHSVRVAHSNLLRPCEMRHVNAEWRLH